MFSTGAKGVRYMEMAEGYVLKTALDENNEVIGYQFVKLGKMMEDIRHGVDPKTAYEQNIGQYGRFDGAAKYIDRVKNNSAGIIPNIPSQASPNRGGSRESRIKEDNLHG